MKAALFFCFGLKYFRPRTEITSLGGHESEPGRARPPPAQKNEWLLKVTTTDIFFRVEDYFSKLGSFSKHPKFAKLRFFYVERKWDQINVFRWRRWRRRQLRRNCDVIEISNDYETASDCGNSPRIWSVVGLRPELWRRHSEKSLSRGWLCSAVKTENLAQTM